MRAIDHTRHALGRGICPECSRALRFIARLEERAIRVGCACGFTIVARSGSALYRKCRETEPEDGRSFKRAGISPRLRAMA